MLERTIAEPGAMAAPCEAMHIMACHESPVGAERPCVGWVHQQLGDGNNIALRLRVMLGSMEAPGDLVSDQHACLEDTLPD